MLPTLLFLSGAAALALEVLWARDWALVYGSTAVGTAVVLAAYFAGLALGALVGGRVGAPARGLRPYAALEGAVAVAVVAYLAVRPALPSAALRLAQATPAGLLPLARTFLAFAVLVMPTTLLGATLPALAAILPAGDAAGAGRLYAWNTLGGAAGALACGMMGVRLLGVRGAFLAAAAIDLAVAVAAAVAPAPVVDDVPGAPATHIPRPGLAVLLAAATGFAGLAGEVLWTRGLAGVLSNSVYSIALVLAAVLLGIVGGAALGMRLVRRAGALAPRLGRTAAALALAILASLLALRALADTSLVLIRGLGVAGPSAGLFVEAVLALLVVLLPATLLGVLFPLTLALAGAEAPGRAMGRVLAANTAGGIAGALVGAFVLLPRLGLGGGLLAMAGLMAGMALLLGGRALATAAAAVVAVAVAAPATRLPWRAPPDERVLFYRDGATATVMVTADAQGHKRLRVNGQYSLGGTDGLLLEAREAHLPLLLHSGPRRLLHLGVGTGDTVGAALAHPGLRVEGVELVKEVLDAAALFAPENRGLLTDPRARLVVDDARSYLLGAPGRYDVVVSDLFLPWTAGTASLYSLDFYRLGRTHLAPGGLYCQWLPLHQLATADLETIVATFAAAFPHVELFVAYHRTTTPLAALVGTDAPLRPDAATIRARLGDPVLGSAAAAAGLGDPGDLAVLYVTDGPHLRTATAGAPLTTDDRPGLEFTAPAAYFHQDGLARAALSWVTARLDPGPAPITGAAAPFSLRRALLGAELALVTGDRLGELRAYLEALEIAPELRTVRQALTTIAAERRTVGDNHIAAVIEEALARGPSG